MKSTFFVSSTIAEELRRAGFEQLSDHTTTWQETTDWLREEKLIDVYVTTECDVNQITGYTGHIHFLMKPTLPTFEIVQGDTIEEDLNYYMVLEKTILKALTYL